MAIEDLDYDYIRQALVIELTDFTLSLKEYRKKLRMTLREVEQETGLNNAYLSQLETGKIKNPSFQAIISLYGVYVLRRKSSSLTDK